MDLLHVAKQHGPAHGAENIGEINASGTDGDLGPVGGGQLRAKQAKVEVNPASRPEDECGQNDNGDGSNDHISLQAVSVRLARLGLVYMSARQIRSTSSGALSGPVAIQSEWAWPNRQSLPTCHLFIGNKTTPSSMCSVPAVSLELFWVCCRKKAQIPVAFQKEPC